MKATMYKKLINDYEDSISSFITEDNKVQTDQGIKILKNLLSDFTTTEVCLDIMAGTGNSFAIQILTKLRKNVKGES